MRSRGIAKPPVLVDAPFSVASALIAEAQPQALVVIAGLVPAIHALLLKKDVDHRDKPGGDEFIMISPLPRP
jgi:hypothetical protein